MTELTAMIENTRLIAPEHFKTLLGERTSGSKWGKEITEDDLYRFAERSVEVTGEVDLSVIEDECRYFRFELADICPGALQNFVFAKDIEYCYVQEGAHGPELVSDEVKYLPVSYGHFITGPSLDDASKQIIYTVYPGELSPQPDPDFFVNRKSGERISQGEIIAAGGRYWPVKGI